MEKKYIFLLLCLGAMISSSIFIFSGMLYISMKKQHLPEALIQPKTMIILVLVLSILLTLILIFLASKIS